MNSAKLTNEAILSQIRDYHQYRDSYLLVDFVTVQDYLQGLEQISKLISSSGLPSVTYLAAAVSDFYVPESQMKEHKI